MDTPTPPGEEIRALLASYNQQGAITGDHSEFVLEYALRKHWIVRLPNGVYLLTVEGVGAAKSLKR